MHHFQKRIYFDVFTLSLSLPSIPVPLLEGGKLWCVFTHPATNRRTMRTPLVTCEGTSSTSVAQLLRRKFAKTVCSGDAEAGTATDRVELVDEEDGSSLYVRMQMERSGGEVGGGGTKEGLRLVLESAFASVINTCPFALSVAVVTSGVDQRVAAAEVRLKPNGGRFTFYPSTESNDYELRVRFTTCERGTFTSTRTIPFWTVAADASAPSAKNSSNTGGSCTGAAASRRGLPCPTGSVVTQSDKDGACQMEVCFTRERTSDGTACLLLSMPQLHALEDYAGVSMGATSGEAVLITEEDVVQEQKEEKGGHPVKTTKRTFFLIATDERKEVVLEAVGSSTATTTATTSLSVCECLNGTCAVLPMMEGTMTSRVCLLKPCPPSLVVSSSSAVSDWGGGDLSVWGNGALHILPPLVFHNDGSQKLTVRHYVLKKDASPTSSCPVTCEVDVAAKSAETYSILANAGYTNWFLLACDGCSSRDYVSITICPGARWKGFVKCGNHFHKVVFQKDGLLDSGHLSISGPLPPPVKVVNLSGEAVAKIKPLSVLYFSSIRAVPFPVLGIANMTTTATTTNDTGSSLSTTSASASDVAAATRAFFLFLGEVGGSTKPVYAFRSSGQGQLQSQQCVYLINAHGTSAKALYGCGYISAPAQAQHNLSFTLRATVSNVSVALRLANGLLHANLPLLSINVSSARGVVDCVCSASGISLQCSSTSGTEAVTSSAAVPQGPPVLAPFSVSLSVMALRFLEGEDVEIGSASLRCAPVSLALSAQFITLLQKAAAELYVTAVGGSSTRAPSPPPPPPPVWYVSIRSLEVSSVELSCHWDRATTAADLPNWGPCSFLLRFLPSMQFFEIRLPPLSTSFSVAKPANLIAAQLKSFYLSELISQIPSAASSFSFSQRKNGLVHFLYTRLGFLFGISPET